MVLVRGAATVSTKVWTMVAIPASVQGGCLTVGAFWRTTSVRQLSLQDGPKILVSLTYPVMHEVLLRLYKAVFSSLDRPIE